MDYHLCRKWLDNVEAKESEIEVCLVNALRAIALRIIANSTKYP